MITKKMIATARKTNDWSFGNKILYDICAGYPGHTKRPQVIAKIWLIGRGYAAAIERVQVKKTDFEDFYLDVVAPKIVNAKIDNWLKPLRSKRLGPLVVSEILCAHRKLTDLFNDMTNLNKRSLASKYLHFHFPNLFFIYDSRVLKALRLLSPILSRVSKSVPNNHYDNEYRKAFQKCMDLRSQIKAKHNVMLSPRELDTLLLGPVLKTYGT